jgi:hypothetical protein
MLRPDLVRIVVLAVVSFLAPSITYTAEKFPDYPVRPIDDYAVKAKKAGLIVAAETVESLDDQQTYFHTKLAPKGYVPVFIILQNKSGVGSFLFDKSRIAYDSSPQAKSKTGEVVAIASLAAISLAGAIVAVKLIANATNIQQNILKKEVQSQTLSPGTSAHGFLYIPVAKEHSREKIHLRVPVTKAGSDDLIEFDLVF